MVLARIAETLFPSVAEERGEPIEIHIPLPALDEVGGEGPAPLPPNIGEYVVRNSSTALTGRALPLA